MSQPLNLSASAARVTVSGGVVNTAVGFYTGITWPILLAYVILGLAIMAISLHGLLAGERSLRLERKLFRGHTISPAEIVEDGVDWLMGLLNDNKKK